MATNDSPTRRNVLTGVGAGAGLVVLAACGSNGNGNGNGNGEGNGNGGSGLLPAGTDLAATADVPVGGALGVEIDGEDFLVTQPAEGEFFAFSAVCTHQGCTVDPAEGELECPCHFSRYDLRTAEVLGGPAPRPLDAVPVTVEGGRVVTT